MNLCNRRKTGKILIPVIIILLGFAAIAALYLSGIFSTGKTIHELLTKNQELKEAITQLTPETQIGYAKVLSQQTKQGRLYTRLLFVETDRTDPLNRVLEKEYEIEGDIIHFDALIVTFASEMVMNGRARSLYLWRRVYGEKMNPQAGYPIEDPGLESPRYNDICRRLSLRDKKLFWQEIWKLSNNPDRLKDIGVKAIYGNVIYRKLKPGLIYVFKIGNTGNLYPEIVPDL